MGKSEFFLFFGNHCSLGSQSCFEDLSNFKVKFGHIGFCMGKSEFFLFFGNHCSLGSQSCFEDLSNLVT